jgi:integrase
VVTETEISILLAKAGDTFRPLIAVLIFAGLRLGEALGLTWEDIYFETGFIRVRRQLGRDRQMAEIKTPAGRRNVVLMPELGKVLCEHKLAQLHCGDSDFVFPAPDGRGRDHRSVSRGIERAVGRAKLGEGISAHNMRHTFASMLIVGLRYDPVAVSKQLGHTSAGFTASTYAHLFEQARHADELRERMSNGFGRLLDVNTMSTRGRNQPKPAPAPVAAIKPIHG